MLYSETDLKKRIKAGCTLFYFYAADEALVRNAAAKAESAFAAEDPERTVLDGPAPDIEEIIAAAGTISFFGGRRLVLLPLLCPAKYSESDLQELKSALEDAENAVFILTSVVEEKYGKLALKAGNKKLIEACEKLGYCAQISKPDRNTLRKMARNWAKESGAAFAAGAENTLVERCGEDQFLLENEVAKLAALSGYGTITSEMVEQLGTVTLDADTFDMVRLVTAGRAGQALKKLEALLALQNDPIQIAGAITGNYIDLYRVAVAKRSRRESADLAADFGYRGYRLQKLEEGARRFHRDQLEQSLRILQKLDLDLKRSKLEAPLLLQKAICELALVGGKK